MPAHANWRLFAGRIAQIGQGKGLLPRDLRTLGPCYDSKRFQEAICSCPAADISTQAG